MEQKSVYHESYMPYVFKWGKITNLVGAVFLFIPCIILSLMGYMPPWSAVGAALIIRVSSLFVGWFAEPISYYPSLGAAGVYMGCLVGSMSNIRLPAALVAQEAAGVENGTEQGNCIATIGVAMSVFVNLALLTITVFFGTPVINGLSTETRSVLNYLLPSLFGTLLANNIIKHPKICAIGIPLGVLLTWGNSVGLLNFLPAATRTAFVMVVSIFGTIALSFLVLLRKSGGEKKL